MSAEPPAVPRLTLAEIRAARVLLGERILTTPALPLAGPAVEAAIAPGTRVLLKLELFQHTGSFKARGALVNALSLTEAERARGVCAISAGNHAIAAAYAARAVGASARVAPSFIRSKACEQRSARPPSASNSSSRRPTSRL